MKNTQNEVISSFHYILCWKLRLFKYAVGGGLNPISTSFVQQKCWGSSDGLSTTTPQCAQDSCVVKKTMTRSLNTQHTQFRHFIDHIGWLKGGTQICVWSDNVFFWFVEHIFMYINALSLFRSYPLKIHSTHRMVKTKRKRERMRLCHNPK